MSHHPEEKEPAFKVVDKRRFNEEGDVRADHEEQKTTQKQTLDNEPQEPVTGPKGMSFSLFVQSLAHQTMMGLGLVPWPDTGLVKAELPLAQQTIDILLVLKEKTTGNLSAEEQDLMDGMLYQLQLAFIEISKMPPPGSGVIIK